MTKYIKRYGGTRRIRGGMISSRAAYPQGVAWEPSVPMSPGVQGNASHIGNHYPYNTNVVPLPESTSNTLYGSCAVGGKRTRRRNKGKGKSLKVKGGKRITKCASKRIRTMTRKKVIRRGIAKKRGGRRDSILPQELVNLYRGGENSLQRFVANFQGLQEPVSPMPAVQSLQGGADLQYSLVDIPKITANADSSVSQL